MLLTESLGFVTGAACVWLAARENIWNWPIGITNNLFYLAVFWHSKLYADACLQVIFAVISAYGWYEWLFGGEGRTEIPMSRSTRFHLLTLLVFTPLATFVLRWALHRFTDSPVPFWDALTTAMSLAAQYLLSVKVLESWLLWIAVNVLYVGLYAYKHLNLTSVLYLIFIVMCISGYRRWSHDMKAVRCLQSRNAEVA